MTIQNTRGVALGLYVLAFQAKFNAETLVRMLREVDPLVRPLEGSCRSSKACAQPTRRLTNAKGRMQPESYLLPEPYDPPLDLEGVLVVGARVEVVAFFCVPFEEVFFLRVVVLVGPRSSHAVGTAIPPSERALPEPPPASREISSSLIASYASGTRVRRSRYSAIVKTR